MKSLPLRFAVNLGLLLIGLTTVGSMQGQTTTGPAQGATTTETGVTTSPGGPAATPFTQVPANGIVSKLSSGDAVHLRRLVRDVVTNTGNIRSTGSFGAQLWLTANGNFFQDWRKPEAPTIEPEEIALRDQPLYTVVIFYGEAHTPAGLSNVSYDISVLRPDGSIYNRRDALIGYQNLAPADDHELQLGRNYLNISIGPDDPAGLYTVNVIVHDNVARVDLPLKQTFVVQ